MRGDDVNHKGDRAQPSLRFVILRKRMARLKATLRSVAAGTYWFVQRVFYPAG